MLDRLKKLFTESIIYSIGNLILKLGGFLIMPLYISYTTSDEFGLIMLLEVITQFTVSISGWGVKMGFQRWYFDMKSNQDQKSLFFTSTIFNHFTSLLASVLVLFIILNFSHEIFKQQLSTTVIILFSGSVLLRLLQDLPFILLKLQQKAIRQTLYQSINIITTLILTYYILTQYKQGLEGVYWGQIIANAMAYIILIPLIIKNSSIKFHLQNLKDMIRYGVPLILSSVLTIIFSLSDRYIISYFKSLSDVGSYSIAFKISSILQLVILAPFITSYTYSYYHYMNNESTDRFYLKSFTYFTFIMAITGLGIVLFSKETIYLLSNGDIEYYNSIPLIPIMILGLIFAGMRQVFTLPLNKAKLTKKISLVIIIAGLLNFGLNLLFIPKFGMIGAAITTAISQLVGALWFFKISKIIDPEPYELSKITKTIIILSILCYGYIYLPETSLILTYLIKLAIIPVFILLLYITGCFEKIEIDSFKGAFRKWRNLKNFGSNIRNFKSLINSNNN